MIPFNIPPFVPECSAYVQQAIDSRKICGDGSFTKRCHAELEAMTGAQKALLTTSGTDALELGALLLDLQPGDEVILIGEDADTAITADDLGAWSGTISYEVLLAATERVHRRWIHDGDE